MISERSTRSPYRGLLQDVRDAGLLRPRRGWYIGAFIWCAAGMVVVTTGLVLTAGTWWPLLFAPLAALVSLHLLYLGHDSAHHQITRNRQGTRATGLIVGNLLNGISMGWWTDKHDRHHHHSNTDRLDPDVDPSIFSWSAGQQLRKRGFARWRARWQAWYLFPLATLTSLSFMYDSVRLIPRRRRGDRGLEAVALVVFFAVYGGGLVWLLGWGPALAFIALHQGILGVLFALAFAPNHTGMPVIDTDEEGHPVIELDHLHKQVLTSRNIVPGWFNDWILGGLNYQIEHHLFPSMPRPNLRAARTLVRQACEEIGLYHHEVSLPRSYVEVLGHLNRVGRGVVTE